MTSEDETQALWSQLKNYKANLRVIQEQKSQFIEASTIPLQLVKNERDTLSRIAQLEAHIGKATIPKSSIVRIAEEEGCSIDCSRALRFIHAEIVSHSLHQKTNPYLQQVDASDLTPQSSISHVYAYTYLPQAAIIRSRDLPVSNPICSICLTHPSETLEKLKDSLGSSGMKRLASPLRKLYPTEKEDLIQSCALVLRESHVICVSFSSLLLGVARSRPDLAYQVVADLMFLPLLQAHKKYGIDQFTCYLSKVGECDTAVLRAFKKVLLGTFPRKGATKLVLSTFEESLLIQVARLFVWAASAHYNRQESKWISMITSIFEGDSSQMEESPIK